MSRDREEELFLAFRSWPGRDTLIALLKGRQDPIFNICDQVLRHSEDAHGASQEVLLEVTRAVGTASPFTPRSSTRSLASVGKTCFEGKLPRDASGVV